MNTLSTYSPASALSLGAWQAHTTLVWIALVLVAAGFAVFLAFVVRALLVATFHHMQSLQTSQTLLTSLQSYHRHTTGFPRRDYARADQTWVNGSMDGGLTDDVPTLDASPFMAARDNDASVNGGSAKAHGWSTGNTNHDIQLDLMVQELALDRLSTRMSDLLEEEKRRVRQDMGL